MSERRVQYKCAIVAGDLAHPDTFITNCEYYVDWVGRLADALIEEDKQNDKHEETTDDE